MAVVLEASLGDGSDCYRAEPRASAIPYQGGRASGSYPISRRLSVGRLFRIRPGGSRSREPITCHDITEKASSSYAIKRTGCILRLCGTSSLYAS